MFAYCGNNPVNSHDPNGMCSHSVYTGGSVGLEGCYRCKNNQNYIDNQDDETIAKKRLGIANVGHAGCGPIQQHADVARVFGEGYKKYYVTIQEVYTMCKRLFIWLLIIAVLVAFNACHSPVYLDFKANSDTNANNNIDAEINSNGDILLDDNGLLCFSSAEEFSQYLHSPKRDDDIAKTNELEKYYMLKNVPDGYELYKITAGSFDIGFWYLPSAALASAESIWAAEAAQEHFLFISPRAELKLSDTLLQHGMTKDDLLDGKYYFKKSTTPVIIWEYDGLVMLLYTPKNQKAINCEDIGQLCELNKICP